MNTYWFTYLESNNNTDFWKHEWEKHGTCAVSGDHLFFPNQKSYFTTVLGLYELYNVSAILEEAGVRPGNQYSLEIFKNAFEHVLHGNTVGMRCTGHYISGVEICLDRDLIPMQCQLSDCPETGELSYQVYP